MYTRLQNLRQRSRSVDKYTDQFFLLITRNEIFDSEIQLVSRFIGGLRPQIQNALMQFDPTTITEAHRRTVAFEQQFNNTFSWSSTNRNRLSGGVSTETGQPGSNIREGEDVASTRLTATGPSGEAQTLRRSSRPNILRCFSCGEAGHIQTACPT